MLGTYFMLQYLAGAGRSDLVYLMMKQKTYPGWGYMIASGANTCWEQWIGYWSNIHSVAFRHLLISPQLTDLIDAQRTEFDSPNGKLVVAWNHQKGGGLEMEIGIPVNTKVDIILPVSADETVWESDQPVTGNGEISIISSQPGKLGLRLASGSYLFKIRKTR